MPFSVSSHSSTYGPTRLALAIAYWLRPPRTRHVPHLLAGLVKDAIVPPPAVPGTANIRKSPPGFAGLVRDESTAVALEAMARGFYAQGHWGRMKWWSPPERAVMRLEDVHIAKRFRRTMRATDMRIAFDTDFSGVMRACAAPRDRGPLHLTWITPKAVAFYTRLHAEGHAHSVEVYDAQDTLVGGLFGVAIGPVFSALSMFHTADNASKFAILSLYHHLESWGFTAVDHQIMSPWVQALGGITLPRTDYESLLRTPATPHASWMAQHTLADTAQWQPKGPDKKDPPE